jgi:hypothetical protein
MFIKLLIDVRIITYAVYKMDKINTLWGGHTWLSSLWYFSFSSVNPLKLKLIQITLKNSDFYLKENTTLFYYKGQLAESV